MNTQLLQTSTSTSTSSHLVSDRDILRLEDRIKMILSAFLAMLRRDLLVTWRTFPRFMIEVLLQPVFLLLIFGKVLPLIGAAQAGFSTLLLPGMVALTILTSATGSVTLPLVLDLGYAREIDDRLLAPLPISLVAIEKVLFAAVRGLIAGVIIFPLAGLILAGGYQVRTDSIGILIGIMVLTALVGASLGMFVGTVVKPEQIGLMFTLIFTPLSFLGCAFYPWVALGTIRWLQILTLFNPLTYAAEGLRYAMVPGSTSTTLGLDWVLLGLVLGILLFLALGVSTFRRRALA